MKKQEDLPVRWTALVLAILFSLPARAIPIPEGFHQEKVRLDGITLNVFKGGRGEPVVLLHGFAQSALMWAPLMEALRDRFTVIVPDLRGAGDSDAPAEGYDKLTMAADVKALLAHYGIPKARIVGHDVGLMVAYALAARYPGTAEKLVVMDAFLPGIGPGVTIYNSPDIWHFRFHGPFAEKLVAGREFIFLDSLWTGFSANPRTFPRLAKKYYADQYARPGRMRAGFAWFTAFPKDARDNAGLAKTKLGMPVLAIGGEKSLGRALVETMKAVSDDVTEKVVSGCGHWMLEECPQESIAAIESFL